MDSISVVVIYCHYLLCIMASRRGFILVIVYKGYVPAQPLFFPLSCATHCTYHPPESIIIQSKKREPVCWEDLVRGN